MGSLSPEEKKSLGQTLTETKDQVTEAYEAKQRAVNADAINQKLNEDIVDGSLDIAAIDQGAYSLLANIRREVEEIFKSLGFIMEYGTEAVTKFENFEAVNIPLTHPATEMHDTIYLQDKDPN
jgi:phenylalanyl-tRNA synthetase alpha chain